MTLLAEALQIGQLSSLIRRGRDSNPRTTLRPSTVFEIFAMVSEDRYAGRERPTSRYRFHAKAQLSKTFTADAVQVG